MLFHNHVSPLFVAGTKSSKVVPLLTTKVKSYTSTSNMYMYYRAFIASILKLMNFSAFAKQSFAMFLYTFDGIKPPID